MVGNSEYFKEWYAANKEKKNAASRKWYANNKARSKELAAARAKAKPELLVRYNRNGKIRRYGITPEDFDRMLVEQAGVCAICSGVSRRYKGRLSIDHCHATGKVRGLLCDSCNVGIGMMKEDGARMLRAIEYLQRHRLTVAV